MHQQKTIVDEIAEYLQVLKSTFYILTQDGKVPGKKMRKHWRFRKNTNDRWLEDAPTGRSSRSMEAAQIGSSDAS